MTLQVYTARLWTRDPDKLDITRGSGAAAGAPFAPSWAILRPALAARREAERREEEARRALVYCETGDDEDACLQSGADGAMDIEAEAWAVYVPAYVEEMRQSYRAHRDAWDALLARPRVVLCCYCVDPARCHRALLADILGKLGADVRGELPAEERSGPTGDSRRDGAIARHRAAYPRGGR